MSARAFREYGIYFQSIDQVKWYNGLSPVNKQGDLYFLLHNFGEQIVSFKLEKLKRDIRKGKKVNLKAYTKPVTRGCKLWLWKERLKERFESMSFKFAALTKSGSDRTGSRIGSRTGSRIMDRIMLNKRRNFAWQAKIKSAWHSWVQAPLKVFCPKTSQIGSCFKKEKSLKNKTIKSLQNNK